MHATKVLHEHNEAFTGNWGLKQHTLTGNLNSKLNEHHTKKMRYSGIALKHLAYFRRCFDAKCLPSKTKQTGKRQNLSGRVFMPNLTAV